MAIFILTEAEQLEIVSLYRTGYLTQLQLAEYFNCSTGTISRVLRQADCVRQRVKITIPQARLLDYCMDHSITLVQIHRWRGVYGYELSA